jgi:hypothetical protein
MIDMLAMKPGRVLVYLFQWRAFELKVIQYEYTAYFATIHYDVRTFNK